MRCPKFRNYDVSPGTKHKRGVKSRVKKLSVTRDQNSIFFLKVDPIPFLGLDLIDPRSSFVLFLLGCVHQPADSAICPEVSVLLLHPVRLLGPVDRVAPQGPHDLT